MASSFDAALIFNPRAGSRRTTRLVAAVQNALDAAGFEVETLPTTGPRDATSLARRAARTGVSTVFVFGGDGTLREAAAGLLGTDVRLAPIPGGTVNVVARAVGLPRHPVRAAAAFRDARPLAMDVGLCGEEIFLMLASAGLDARVMSSMTPGFKRHFGVLAIALSGLLQWTTYDYRPIDCMADGQRLSATLVAVCNLPHYAGSRKMAPAASATDRCLDLVVFRGRGRSATLGFARDFLMGRHLDRADVELARVEQVEIHGPQGLCVQLDGDALPIRLPVTVRLATERLQLLVPRTAGSPLAI